MASKYPSIKKYLVTLERKWLGILLLLAAILVPLFGLLDVFMIPADHLAIFWSLRGGVVIICMIQYVILFRYTPGNYVTLHAYFFTLCVGGAITCMTTYLGGFDSPYYAGLNLVLLAINIFMPWTASKSTLNSALLIIQYVGWNLFTDPFWDSKLLINNLYFIGATAVITVTIGHYKYKLTRSEFDARTALWGEMKIANKIQTALLPERRELPGYKIACIMMPAEEVGGDYYDIIAPENSKSGWVMVGDVSGHGVTAGLIMMMTHTSIQSLIHSEPEISPSRLLSQVNDTLKDDITRLGENKYLTISALKIKDSHITFAGKHQDILIYRRSQNQVDRVATTGFWLGIRKKIDRAFSNESINMNPGDLLLLYTDGVTELRESEGPMFGIERLMSCLKTHAHRPDVHESLAAMLKEIKAYSKTPEDDISMVLLEKT